MAKSHEWMVQWSITKNINTTSEILEVLGRNPYLDIEEDVFTSPKILPEALARLAEDTDYDWRRIEICVNPNTESVACKHIRVV